VIVVTGISWQDGEEADLTMSKGLVLVDGIVDLVLEGSVILRDGVQRRHRL
jgi:hypothetical protein